MFGVGEGPLLPLLPRIEQEIPPLAFRVREGGGGGHPELWPLVLGVAVAVAVDVAIVIVIDVVNDC